MVNGVNENKFYTYTKTKNVNIPNTGEKFSLNYNKDDLQAKDGEKKDDASGIENGRKSEASQNGVRLELSNTGKNAALDVKNADASKADKAAGGQSFLEMIKGIIDTVKSAVKDLLYKIWYDSESKDETGKNDEAVKDAQTETGINSETAINTEAVENIKVETSANPRTVEDIKAETKSEAELQKNAEERLDREIRPYLRKGDLNKVINLLTDNGKKTVAINSTLLTYYDRNGRMVEISASDKERILRGDRNTRKL